ncbi:MAG: peptide chain release factor N(5)-glutamine methyltransferase [Deltaproteobacteria bacterium]|nr:peptide chain release factor N(5)-glutamine methyltransferase [Deltaproteobacteria bacterium]
MKAPQPSSEGPWTILKLLEWTTGYFKTQAIDNPRSTAEVLLAHALGLQRLDLYLQYDRPMNADELRAFKTLIKRRLAREPVAYITGSREFWSLDFHVNRDVLIPRPETECLVETAVAVVDAWDAGRPGRILELGTGSGAVIISLAGERPGHRYFASDISSAALSVARANSASHGKEAILFFAGDWLAPVTCAGEGFDLVLSNPPYIRRSDIDGLQPEIHRYEPRQALNGEEDGLGSLRRLIETAPDCLREGGHLLLEIGYGQEPDVEAMARLSGRYDQTAFAKDYSGIARVVKLRRGA